MLWTTPSAQDGPTAKSHPAQTVSTVRPRNPVLAPERLSQSLEKKGTGQEGAFPGKESEAAPPAPAPQPLLLTSRPRQVTRVDQTGDGREEPLSQITCSFAFWSKTHFSYYMSDRTGNPAFFFFFLQGKTTQASQKHDNLPGRSLDCPASPWQITTLPTDVKFTHQAQSNARITKAKNCEFH